MNTCSELISQRPQLLPSSPQRPACHGAYRPAPEAHSTNLALRSSVRGVQRTVCTGGPVSRLASVRVTWVTWVTWDGLTPAPYVLLIILPPLCYWRHRSWMLFSEPMRLGCIVANHNIIYYIIFLDRSGGGVLLLYAYAYNFPIFYQFLHIYCQDLSLSRQRVSCM